MEKCKERILKRIKSQHRAVKISSIVFWIIVTIVAFYFGGFQPGIVLSLIFGIVLLIVALPIMSRYKKAMNIISNTNPTVCTVIGAGMEHISNRISHQVAYFIYDGKECYGFDYEKAVHEIKAGQELYVWKITKKSYEIAHVE